MNQTAFRIQIGDVSGEIFAGEAEALHFCSSIRVDERRLPINFFFKIGIV